MREHARTDDDELRALLEAWRQVRAPELADAIDVVSARSVGKPLPKSGSLEAKQGRWFERLAQRPNDLEPFLDALTDVSAYQVEDRLSVLAERDDPRIARKLTELVRSPPFVNVSTMPLWVLLFELLERLADRRCLDTLRACDDGWVQKFRPHARPLIAELVAQAVPRIEAACAAVPHALPPDEAQRLTRRFDLGRAETEARLFDAITQNLDDDEPRLVYADFLMSRDDPRGELIALMVSDQQPERVQALLQEHEATWLGELVHAVTKVEWSRGFPARGVLSAKRSPDAARAIGDPRWRTFEHLHDASDFVNMMPLLTDPALENLRSIEWLAAKDARHLVGVPRPLPLRRLGLRAELGPLKRLSKTLADATSLDALETLALIGYVFEDGLLDWFTRLTARLGRPLELELNVAGEWRVVVDAPPKVRSVEPQSPRSSRGRLVAVMTQLGLTPPKEG